MTQRGQTGAVDQGARAMAVSKAEQARRVNYHYMADAMRMLEWDLHSTILDRMRIPDEWHEIAREKPVPKKTRVTLRLDADLVAFFRSMGPDWQVRVNRLMSVWMHARLAGVIRGGETMDYLARREPELLDGTRPEFGGYQLELDAAIGAPEAGASKAPGGVPMVETRVMSPAARRALMEEMKSRNGMGEV
ncbi:BrnA antitoxin family protein [Paracoccus spongiarum]|uniref:BrnA antitoxin family protein n=1 Tax=Paracoccus spongiarum TaxID=3064387 RepID=A0ABT9JBQ9_9RHOB|nr:BrnA antitoxin family protein [Paracoccus sp. 2205BS29-5]MDP5306556.1 BrnA antitoxin family protein [Paracoccus sp. 2205BS29-5]